MGSVRGGEEEGNEGKGGRKSSVILKENVGRKKKNSSWTTKDSRTT